MLNTDSSAAKPFLTPVPSKRGLDRLRIVPVDAAPTSFAEALTSEEAVARLTAAGLACAAATGPRLHILGGARGFVERDVPGYSGPFAILAEPGSGFIVMVAGARGTHDEEALVDTLAQAVDTVLRIYRSRGAIPAAEVRR
ncbi:MAG: hypothetical protein ABJE95_12135 [Byssovorax sp.]